MHVKSKFNIASAKHEGNAFSNDFTIHSHRGIDEDRDWIPEKFEISNNIKNNSTGFSTINKIKISNFAGDMSTESFTTAAASTFSIIKF